MIPALKPKVWENGLTSKYLSSPERVTVSVQRVNVSIVCRWVTGTPFGTPVVPDVNRMSETDSGSTDELRASAAATGTSPPRARNRAHERSSASAVSSSFTVVRSSGSVRPASRSIPA